MRKRESMVSLTIYGKDRIKSQLIKDKMLFLKKIQIKLFFVHFPIVLLPFLSSAYDNLYKNYNILFLCLYFY